MKLFALTIVFLIPFSLHSKITYKPELRIKPREVGRPTVNSLPSKDMAALTVRVVGEAPLEIQIRAQVKCGDNRWYEVPGAEGGVMKTVNLFCASDKPNDATFGSSTTRKIE